MKTIFLVVSTLVTHSLLAQETGTYQSDSIYKANKVKARLWYSGTNKQLGITTFYDTEGRLIKYQLEPMIEGTQVTTYYSYGPDGKLVSMVDTIKNGEPDKKQIENLRKMGLDPDKLMKKDKNKAPVEVARYDLIYSGDQLTKITKYNPDGSLDIVDNLSNNGKTEIRDWYQNGKLVEQSTSEYLTKFHKAKYSGWEIRDGKKSEWEYTFKYEFDRGRVKSFVRYDRKKKMETTKYFYDDKGLLVKSESYIPDFFEYIYY